MYKTFAPRLNGRYLSSNVNITVTDARGNNVSVPVGGMFHNSFMSEKTLQAHMLMTQQSALLSLRRASKCSRDVGLCCL